MAFRARRYLHSMRIVAEICRAFPAGLSVTFIKRLKLYV